MICVPNIYLFFHIEFCFSRVPTCPVLLCIVSGQPVTLLCLSKWVLSYDLWWVIFEENIVFEFWKQNNQCIKIVVLYMKEKERSFHIFNDENDRYVKSFTTVNNNEVIRTKLTDKKSDFAWLIKTVFFNVLLLFVSFFYNEIWSTTLHNKLKSNETFRFL
jgi:hypothetical protein